MDGQKVPNEETFNAAEFASHIASLDNYNDLSDSDRDVLREAVYNARVNSRSHYDVDYSSWVLVPLWIIISTAGEWNIDLLGFGADFSWRTVAVPLVCAAVAICALVPILTFLVDESAERHDIGNLLQTKLLPSVSAILLFLVSVRLSPGGLVGALLALFVLVFSVLVSSVILIVLKLSYDYVHDRMYGPKLDPRDDLISSLADILDATTREGNNWQAERSVRQTLARRIEWSASAARKRIPLVVRPSQPAVRADLKSMAGRMASALNRYATDVAIGGAERDRILVDNISNALLLVSLGRWEELAVDEEYHPVKTFLRRFVPRIATAGALLVMGVVLPDMIGSWADPIAPQLRVALIAAAILSVIDTPKSATERIADAFKSR